MTSAYFIDAARCTGCGLCAEACSQQAIRVEDRGAVILADLCTGCGTCETVCRRSAIQPVHALLEPVPVTGSVSLAWQPRRRARCQRWRQSSPGMPNSGGWRQNRRSR
jgi:ferredoxin